MARSSTARLLGLSAALVVSLGLGSSMLRGCWHDLADGPLSRNYSRRPPEQAFERAFNRKVPPGVSELRAAGQSWAGGTNVWMRFQAPPPLIDELLAGCERVPANRQEIADHLAQWRPTLLAHPNDPQNRLRWSELGKAKKLDAFLVSREPSGAYYTQGWLDRDTHDVYIFIFGI